LNTGNANNNSKQNNSKFFNLSLQNCQATNFIMFIVTHFTGTYRGAASIRQGMVLVHIIPIFSFLSTTAFKLHQIRKSNKLDLYMNNRHATCIQNDQKLYNQVKLTPRDSTNGEEVRICKEMAMTHFKRPWHHGTHG